MDNIYFLLPGWKHQWSLHLVRLTLKRKLTCKCLLKVNLYVQRIMWITARRQLALKGTCQAKCASQPFCHYSGMFCDPWIEVLSRPGHFTSSQHRRGGGALLVNLLLLKMLSVSASQQVAPIGCCTYHSLVNLSLWWLKDCPRKTGISHRPCQ